jgi:hypothetical protein
MKTRGLILAAAFCLLLLGFGLSRTWSSQSSAAHQAGASIASLKAVELDGCKITVLSIYFWRDWMPIVEHPGSDHGSPLYAKVKLLLENSKSEVKKLDFTGAAIDEKGRSYPVTFAVLPKYDMLPQDVYKAYSSLDEQGKKDVMAKYHVVWEGGLEPGQAREIELISHDGPYLPVGSRVHIEFTFTDQQGRSAIVKTPPNVINRTD